MFSCLMLPPTIVAEAKLFSEEKNVFLIVFLFLQKHFASATVARTHKRENILEKSLNSDVFFFAQPGLNNQTQSLFFPMLNIKMRCQTNFPVTT